MHRYQSLQKPLFGAFILAKLQPLHPLCNYSDKTPLCSSPSSKNFLKLTLQSPTDLHRLTQSHRQAYGSTLNE